MGYTMQDGRWVYTNAIELFPPGTELAEGVTIGDWVEMGDATALRLILAATAKSGTNPTLDVTVQTSRDKKCVRSLGTLAQKTNAAAFVMGAVVVAHGSGPTLTLSGTPTRLVELDVVCTTGGARGTWKLKYSTDGGSTWTYGVTSAATIPLLTSKGEATGVTLAIGVGTATVDDEWTASPSTRGFVMSAVAPDGTTPPTVTLTGALEFPVAFKAQCTSIAGGAARGQWTGRYSLDGGTTWVAFTSAATVALEDADGNVCGLTMNIATGNAAVDNVWTASTANAEEKSFGGCDRWVRAVALVGGSSTPTMTAGLTGEAV